MTVADEEALSSALIAEMSVAVDRAQLVTRAHEMRWARRWRIPARRSIERRVLEAVQRVEAADMEALSRVLRPEETERLYKDLVEGRAHGASVLEWIRRPASNRGKKSRALVVSKLEFSRQMTDPARVYTGMPSVSPDGKWIAFAGQQNRGPLIAGSIYAR